MLFHTCHSGISSMHIYITHKSQIKVKPHLKRQMQCASGSPILEPL